MIPLIITGGVLILGVVFYFFSVQSRKRYHCPQCGEWVQVEHMDAFRCGMCGAPLKQGEK